MRNRIPFPETRPRDRTPGTFLWNSSCWFKFESYLVILCVQWRWLLQHMIWQCHPLYTCIRSPKHHCVLLTSAQKKKMAAPKITKWHPFADQARIRLPLEGCVKISSRVNKRFVADNPRTYLYNYLSKHLTNQHLLFGRFQYVTTRHCPLLTVWPIRNEYLLNIST